MIASKLSIEFNKIKDQVKEVYIAVGMITDKKFDYLFRNIPITAKSYIITGVHLPTSPSVLEKLKDSITITGKAFTKKFFHPKLYLFHTTEKWIGFVGSGNFTDGGWHENEELFIKIEDENTCLTLKLKFDSWFAESVEITDKLIEIYTSTFNANASKQNEVKTNISQLLDFLNNKFNIENVDFTDHFFQKEDHLTFDPKFSSLETPEILTQRNAVRNKLYKLNALIERLIPNDWHIESHYDYDHKVAHIENDFHHDFRVQALWVAYGRSKTVLKKYGDWATPLRFMRMQVIMHYDSVGIWLMPGKKGEGQIDRDNFRDNMNKPDYRQEFFDLIQKLDEKYWILISGESRPVKSFDSADNLWTFTKNDNWRDYYYIIGKDYQAGSNELESGKIVKTVIDNFTLLMPIYNKILAPKIA